jgi:hypothetical protein
MAAFNIIEFVLMDMFQISNDIIRDYSSTQEQLLYLILIPNTVLLLFVYIFADAISRMAIPGPGAHRGFKILFGIVAYITIIATGWFGNILLPLFNMWWQASLVLALIFFMMSRILHPAAMKSVVAGSALLGKSVTQKGQNKKALEKELRITEEQLTRIGPLASGGNYMYTAELARLQAKKAQIEAELAG